MCCLFAFITAFLLLIVVGIRKREKRPHRDINIHTNDQSVILKIMFTLFAHVSRGFDRQDSQSRVRISV